jgi:N-acetyl-gamma-glutamyl-phosphate reductase
MALSSCSWLHRTPFLANLFPRRSARGLRIVDLSGAWRLKQEQNRAIYGFKDANAQTAAELTERAVYGLPELN